MKLLELVGIGRRYEPVPQTDELLGQMDGLWRSSLPETAISFLKQLDVAFVKSPPTAAEKVFMKGFVTEHMDADPQRKNRFLQILQHITPHVPEPVVLEALRHDERNDSTRVAEGSLGILIQLKSKDAIKYIGHLIAIQAKEAYIPHTLGATYEALANKPDSESVALLKDGLAYCRTHMSNELERRSIVDLRESILVALANNKNPASVDVLLAELSPAIKETLGNLYDEENYLYAVVTAIRDWGLPLDDRRYAKLTRTLNLHESSVVNAVARGMLPPGYGRYFTQDGEDEVKRSEFGWAENELAVLRSIIAVYHGRHTAHDISVIEGHIQFARPRSHFLREMQLYELATRSKSKAMLNGPFETERPALRALEGVIETFQYNY